MYTKNKPAKTSIKRNTSYQGETIEQKINRIVNNKEPIKDGAPVIYTDRKDGVRPEYDIRSDRFEMALDATSYMTKTHVAKRDERIGERSYDTMTPEQQNSFHEKYPNNKYSQIAKAKQKPDGGAEPAQATGPKT